jgi:hypothetical protein
MVSSLKDIAFRIHIEPLKTVEQAAKVDTVIKVLSDIIKSYNNYLEVEFFKNEGFKKIYDRNIKVLDTLRNELNLLIVDLNFGSFEAALAPNVLESYSPIFKNEVQDWKRETFSSYRDFIIMGDYNDYDYLKEVIKRYSDHERNKIYQPLFASVGDGKEYRLNVKDQAHNTIRTIFQPEKSKYDIYVPKIHAEKEPPIYSTAQVYLKIRKEGDTPKITTRNVKEILYYEELEHETYPYKPDIINYNGCVFILNKKLDCQVEFDDQHYIIKNPELDIVVWGQSREEVEEAFRFSFYSLYVNYVLEADENLSEEALSLKKILQGIIKYTVNETQKD